MTVIHDEKQIHTLIRRYHIETWVSTPGLDYQLQMYEKGEILCSPLMPLDSVLFLTGGTVQVYDLGQNGRQMMLSMASASRVQLFGDWEFSTGRPTPFFAEVREPAVCLALSMTKWRDALLQDTVFLRRVAESLAEKLSSSAGLNTLPAALEEKVRFLMENPSGEHRIHNVGKTAAVLHCSQRQLQRVLKTLCEKDIIRKEGKGTYVLLERGNNRFADD